jgi:hypothetical protein
MIREDDSAQARQKTEMWLLLRRQHPTLERPAPLIARQRPLHPSGSLEQADPPAPRPRQSLQ